MGHSCFFRSGGRVPSSSDTYRTPVAHVCQGLRYLDRAPREGWDLEDPHWAVPDDRLRTPNESREQRYGLRTNINDDVTVRDEVVLALDLELARRPR